MAGAGDERELEAADEVDRGEELLVTVGVDDDVGQQRRTVGGQRVVGELGVQHVDRDVADAGPVLGEKALDDRVRTAIDEYQGDASTRGDDDMVAGTLDLESELLRQRVLRVLEVVDGDDDMVDARCRGVDRRGEAARTAASLSGAGSGLPAATSIRWVSASSTRTTCSTKSGSRPASIPHCRLVPSTSRTRFGWITAAPVDFLALGDLLADLDPLGEHPDQLGVERVDAQTQIAEIEGRIGHGAVRRPGRARAGCARCRASAGRPARRCPRTCARCAGSA